MWYLRSLEYKPTLLRYFENEFNEDEKSKLEEIAKKQRALVGDARVGGLGESEEIINTSIRRTRVSFIDTGDDNNHWLYRKLVDVVNRVNFNNYNYNLTYIEPLQFGRYEANTQDYYTWHLDTDLVSPDVKINNTRKLSFSILLTDPQQYKGGDFMVHSSNVPEKIEPVPYSILFFPSRLLHTVTPVTEGVRESIVGWVSGPQFS